MNVERLKKFLFYLAIFAFEAVLIMAILVALNGLADVQWLWSRR